MSPEDAVQQVTGADKGNLQLLQPEAHTLVITALRGFHKPFLEQRNRDGD